MDETTSCERVRGADYLFGGQLAPLLHGVTEQWLKIAPLANPAMLEMFRDRDCPPLRDLLPWSGEFAGKYLTSAVQILRLTGDPELHEFLSHFVDELTSLQAADGYLGPFPLDSRLLGEAPRPESSGRPPRSTVRQRGPLLRAVGGDRVGPRSVPARERGRGGLDLPQGSAALGGGDP